MRSASKGGVLSIKTFMAFGCTHIPHHDKENAAWIIEQIKERQPNIIVHLGDLIDCESVSNYPKYNSVSLSAEYAQVGEFLEAVNDASPKSRKIFMQGNHEERITRPEYNHVSDLLDYTKHIKSLKRWKCFPYILDPRYTYTLGQLTFAHGWAFTAGGSSERKEGIDISGQTANGCYIHAHTHRPLYEQMSLNTWKLPFWRCNVGCGIDFDWVNTGYAKGRNISQWHHALVSGWAETKRRHDGKRNWEIELIKRKGAWE